MARLSNKTRLLQKIDACLFPGICTFFTCWHRLKQLFHKRDAATPPKSIIFLKLAEQGSTVLANEAIRQAVACVGRENVFFLMFEENRFILDVMDLIPRENVLTIPTKSAWTMATGCLARLLEIRRRKIEACIDMEFFARSSAVICYLMHTRIRVGFHCYFGEGPHRGNLFTHRVLYNSHIHASRTFLALVRALDNPPAQFPAFPYAPPAEISLAHFQPTDAERAEVAAMLRAAAAGGEGRAVSPKPPSGTVRSGGFGVSSEATGSATALPKVSDGGFGVSSEATGSATALPITAGAAAPTVNCKPETVNSSSAATAPRLILLNANASDLLPLRRWDNANYIVLARRLLETFPDAVIAFTGAPSEQPKIAGLVAEIASPRCFSLAGKTTMRQLLILYGLAEILVTNDSGPAHFAALTPVDVVVLFGPETPELFGTLSPRNHAIWLGLACSPCINAWNNRQTACRNNLCMKNITVDQVFETVSNVYKQRAAAQST